MRTKGPMLVLLLLMSASQASAANLDLPRAEIRINLHDKVYILKSWSLDFKEFPPQSLENSMSFSIIPGEKVSIFVEDPDPFSNTYSWLVGNNSTTTNLEAAQGFADKLLGIVKGLEPPKGGSANLAPLNWSRPDGGIALAAYHQQSPGGTAEPIPPPIQLDQSQRTPSTSSVEVLEDAGSYLATLSAMSTDSQATAQSVINDAAQKVRSKPAPQASAQIQEILAQVGIPDAEKFLQGFKSSIGKLYLLSAQAQALMKDVSEGHGKAAKAVVNSWELSKVEKELTSDYDLMHAVGEAMQAKLSAAGRVRESNLTQGLDFDSNRPDSSATREELTARIGAKEAAIQELVDKNLLITWCIKLRISQDGRGADMQEDDCRKLMDAQKRDAFCETQNGKPVCLEVLFRCNPNSPPSKLQKDDLSCGGLSLVELERNLDVNDSRLQRLRIDSKNLVILNKSSKTVQDVEKYWPRDPFFLSLVFILPRETDTREALRSLRRFETAMQSVDVPIKVGEIDFADAGAIRNATLRIETNPSEGSVRLVKTDLPPGTKEYHFAFRPYSSFQLGVGGAAVFSFAKTHKFEVVPVTGGFRINDAQTNDYTGASVAAMLTVVPSVWAKSDFHPLFEIGAGPESSIALYAGAGVQFGKVFSFGAGLVFQQVDRLVPGLSLGQVLTNPSDLKTRKVFTTGVYLHLTATANLSGGKGN